MMTIGVFGDPHMEWKAGFKKTLSITVQRAMRHMAESVVSKVNKAYLGVGNAW